MQDRGFTMMPCHVRWARISLIRLQLTSSSATAARWPLAVTATDWSDPVGSCPGLRSAARYLQREATDERRASPDGDAPTAQDCASGTHGARCGGRSA